MVLSSLPVVVAIPLIADSRIPRPVFALRLAHAHAAAARKEGAA